MNAAAQPRRLSLRIESLPLREPFHISGKTFHDLEVLIARVSRDGVCGRGEAAGVFYLGDEPAAMLAQAEAVRPQVEAGISREALQRLLPRGGARNALDCALWELEAALAGTSVHALLGMPAPRPLITTFTLGAESPERMVEAAGAFGQARAIKIKLLGDGRDAARVQAVRGVFPQAWLGVDANRSLDPARLRSLLPALVEAGVGLLEQPFPVGRDGWLAEFSLPLPVAADESVQGVDDIARLASCYDVINIKLDKCGGLTEAMAMVAQSRAHGLQVMVGNMIGTSWAMAPAFLVGQHSQVVDLDGPALLARDRSPGIRYEGGEILCDDAVWGCGEPA